MTMTAEQKIISALSRAPAPLSAKKLAKAARVNDNTCRRVLGELLTAGKITHTSAGYALRKVSPKRKAAKFNGGTHVD